MPQAVTPDGSAWPSGFSAHADGDPVDGPGWLARIQDYADALEFIRLRAEGVAINYTRQCPMIGLVLLNFTFETGGGPGNNAIGWTQSSVATPTIMFPLPVPQGDTASKLNSVKIYFRPQGSGATHAALPANQPSLQIFRQPSDGSAAVSLGTATLAAGSVAAYEAPQSITVTIGGGHVISNGDSYYALFGGESGANALVDLVITRLEYVNNPI